MNSYNIDEIAIAQLILVSENGAYAGLKNIIGIPVYKNKNCYFYSILDDCFFRVMVFHNNDILNKDEIYAYLYDVDFGKINIKKHLIRRGFEKTTLTKEEIIIGGFDLLSVYLSDLDYLDIKRYADVDYRELESLEMHLIVNELQYEQVLDRPIMYTDGIVSPSNKKRLLKK